MNLSQFYSCFKHFSPHKTCAMCMFLLACLLVLMHAFPMFVYTHSKNKHDDKMKLKHWKLNIELYAAAVAAMHKQQKKSSWDLARIQLNKHVWYRGCGRCHCSRRNVHRAHPYFQTNKTTDNMQHDACVRAVVCMCVMATDKNKRGKKHKWKIHRAKSTKMSSNAKWMCLYVS